MSEDFEQMTRGELVHELRLLSHELNVYHEETRVQTQQLVESQRVIELSRDRYVELFDMAPVGYANLNGQGLVVDINLSGASMLGFHRRQLIGSPMLTHVALSHRRQFLEHLRLCRQGSERIITELELLGPQGRPFPVQLASRRFPDFDPDESSDEAIVFATAITDLSERKRAESALRESEERLKLAQAASGAGIWDCDLASGRWNWSEEHFLVMGLLQADALPSYETWLSAVQPVDRGLVSKAFADVAQLGAIDVTYRVSTSKSGTRWLATRGKLLRDESGTARRITGITADVTELKRTEEQLQELNVALEFRTAEAESHAALLGQLAAELTHAEQRERQRLARVLHDHLQQLLVAAKLNIGMIRDDEEARHLSDSLMHTEALLEECIEASRSLTVELSPPILHERGLGAALQWLTRWMGDKHGLTVRLACDADLPRTADASSILVFEAVRELLFNVVKHAHVDRARVSLKLLREVPLLEVEVADEGTGFQPGRPDDWSDSPTGYGLSSIRQRVALMGGSFEIVSGPQEGTRAVLRMPFTAEREVTDRHEPPQRPLVSPVPEAGAIRPIDGPIRVMIADDHRVVREGLASLLRQERRIELVAEVSDGAAAVRVARKLRPDVVIMDINMPRMNGIEATRQIRELIPQTCVIGLSMHRDEAMAQAMEEAGASYFFTKGGRVSALIAAILAFRASASPVGQATAAASDDAHAVPNAASDAVQSVDGRIAARE